MSARQETIDAFKKLVAAGGATLDEDPGFKQAMGELPSDALVRAWLDGASATARLRASVPAGETDLFDKLGTLDWLSASLSTSAEGVRLDLSVRGEPGSLIRSSAGGNGGFHPSLAGRLPSDAFAYLAFHGTKAMFSAGWVAARMLRMLTEATLNWPLASSAAPASGMRPHLRRRVMLTL